ncbi:MAG: cellulase family glycosylhydrolase [Eubacterium sp.]|nr:cellulase family glycosylhydrolase [Eubacterium sp.]
MKRTVSLLITICMIIGLVAAGNPGAMAYTAGISAAGVYAATATDAAEDGLFKETPDNLADSGVTAAITANENDYWSEYGIVITNNSGSDIKKWTIKAYCPDVKIEEVYSYNSVNLSYESPYLFISSNENNGNVANGSDNSAYQVKFGSRNKLNLSNDSIEEVTFTKASSSATYECNYTLTGEVKDLAANATPYGMHGNLKVAGTKIHDKNNKDFQLRGASLHGIQWDVGYNYINKGAFQSLRDEWGINAIRLPAYVTQGGYTAGSAAAMDTRIQNAVEIATELGMYVLIDWHVHSDTGLKTNPNTWKAEAETFFEKYSSMYKDYGNVLFEIANEPVDTPWYDGSGNDLYSYSTYITDVIRNNCDNIVICGTNTWSQDVEKVAEKPLTQENVMYTIHFYSATHRGEIRNKVKTAISAGTPVFCTEFGVCSSDGNGSYDLDEADEWMSLFDENGISYFCWQLSNKNEKASYLVPGCTKTNGGWTNEDLSQTGMWLINTNRPKADLDVPEENPDDPVYDPIPDNPLKADNILDTPTNNTEGNIIIGVNGSYYAAEYLAKLNEVRREAYAEGLVDPSDPDHERHLSLADYVPLKWSNELEQIAAIRAAEACIKKGHMRPNVYTNTFALSVNGISSQNEIIAFNDDPIHGIKNDSDSDDPGSWYYEKKFYVEGDYSTTGHYISIITPDNKYVGASTFLSDNTSGDYGSYMSIDAEFSTKYLKTSDTVTGLDGQYIQKLEVDAKGIQDLSIAGYPGLMYPGNRTYLKCEATLYFVSEFNFKETTYNCPVFSNITWSSSEPSVADIDEDGLLTAHKVGDTIVTCHLKAGTVEKTIERRVHVAAEGVTVESVEDPEEITIEAGGKPLLPATVTAVLSDGTEIQADVEWNETDSNRNQYHSQNIYAHSTTIAGESLGFDVNQKVNVKACVPTKAYFYDFDKKELAETVTITTESGVKPDYPKIFRFSCKAGMSHYFTSYNQYSGWPVTWSDESMEYYKTRKGGTFTLEGDFNGYPVEATLIVKPATITKVELSSTKITTPSGTAPELPYATITWSNGDVQENVRVTWNQDEVEAIDYHNRIGHTYTVHGTVSDFEGNKTDVDEVEVTVLDAYVTKAEIAEESETVEAGIAPSHIPGTAKITWSNEDETEEDIQWDSDDLDNIDYMAIEGGTFEINGLVKGEALTFTVYVNPATITSVEPLPDVTQFTGKKPVLAEKATVNWSNGSNFGKPTEETITWDEYDESLYKTPGTFTVTGTVSDSEGTTTAVEQTVLIKDPALTDLEWITVPDKTKYMVDEDLSIEGGKFKAVFDDESETEVELKADMVSGFDSSEEQTKQRLEVTYSFTSNNGTEDVTVTKTLVFFVDIIQRVAEEIKLTPPTVTEYPRGTDMNLDGGSLYIKFNDGEEVTADLSDLTITGYNSNELGEQTVTVKYTDPLTKAVYEESFTVTVRYEKLIKVELVKSPDKDTYYLTEKVDFTGGILFYTYDNNTYEQINMEDMHINGEYTLYEGTNKLFLICHGKNGNGDVEVHIPIVGLWPFNDVKPTDGLAPNIVYAYDKGIIGGFTPLDANGHTYYKPEKNVTRAQFAVMVYNMAGKPEFDTTPYEDGTISGFKDVAPGSTGYKEILWASSNGIISGFDNGTFKPKNTVSRAQIAIMLKKYADFRDYRDKYADPDTSSDDYKDVKESFADSTTVAAMNPAQIECLQWAVDNGILSGSSKGIQPKGTARRDQCAAFFARFYEKFEE